MPNRFNLWRCHRGVGAGSFCTGEWGTVARFNQVRSDLSVPIFDPSRASLRSFSSTFDCLFGVVPATNRRFDSCNNERHDPDPGDLALRHGRDFDLLLRPAAPRPVLVKGDGIRPPSASSHWRQGPTGHQTFTCFQRPRRKKTTLITARVEKAMVIAANTPRGPNPTGLART